MDSVSQADMRRMAERLRIIAENSAIRGELFKDVEVTVSIGGTKIRTDDSYESLMDRLAVNLKTAKSKGGNSSHVK
jgi:GGDEF domain-containing protein